MSRENRVNPGMYTQRGRLTQDDAARELRKQSAFESMHVWQPVKTRRTQLGPAGDVARDTEGAADSETETKEATSPPVEARPASPETRPIPAGRVLRARRAASPKAKPTAVKAKAASSRTSKKTAGKTSARKTATARKAVTARKAATARKTAKGSRRGATTTRRMR